MKCNILIFLVICCLMMTGCNQGRKSRDAGQPEVPDRETLIRANQMMVQEDEKKIILHADDMDWNLTKTGTGLFYEIHTPPDVEPNHAYRSRKTGKISSGDWVSVSYTLRLLDGTLCYQSSDSGPRQFVVEKSEAESGLHEAMKLLGQGDSARIILPPHRAYGLMGNGDRIPGRAILWYEIRVDSVIPGNHI